MELNIVGSNATNVSRVSESRVASPTPASVTANQEQVQTANAVQKAAAAPSVDQVKQAVDNINKSMHVSGLDFSFDPKSDKTIVKVIDRQTSEVIRQFPTEQALAMSKSLDEAIGKLVKEEA